MNNYFVLNRSIDPKIVGNRGFGQAYISEDFLLKNTWYDNLFYPNDSWTKDSWKRWANITQYGGNLLGIYMEKTAKHTDYIDFGRFLCGFIVNNKLKDLLEREANLPNHKFFKVTFNQKEQIVEGYWWFTYDRETGEHTVDFAQCEYDFESHKRRINADFTANIQYYEDYINLFYETGFVPPITKLVLKKEFNRELDIWGTQFLTLQKAYISDRLLEIFEQNKITGYEVKLPKEPLIFHAGKGLY